MGKRDLLHRQERPVPWQVIMDYFHGKELALDERSASLKAMCLCTRALLPHFACFLSSNKTGDYLTQARTRTCMRSQFGEVGAWAAVRGLSHVNCRGRWKQEGKKDRIVCTELGPSHFCLALFAPREICS